MVSIDCPECGVMLVRKPTEWDNMYQCHNYNVDRNGRYVCGFIEAKGYCTGKLDMDNALWESRPIEG